MKKIILLFFLCSFICSGNSQEQKDKNKYVGSSDWSELKTHKIPEWFKDAKFGIYAHLGVYCVPAYGNEWYPSQLYKYEKDGSLTGITKYHIKKYGDLKKFGYKDFIPMFKAEKFNAAQWAQLFKDAGAKFAGIVTEHHDGFAMWDSKVNPWNAAQMGPKQNLYGEIAKEIRKRDMKLLATFHHGITYTSYYNKKNHEADLDDPKAKYLYGRIPKDEGDRRWFEQIKEVIDKYKPDQIWFDFDIRGVDDKVKYQFAKYYYSKEKEWGRDLIITRKYDLLPAGVGVLDVERGGRDKIYKDLWQTDDAVAVNSWCWVNDLKLKTSTELIHELIDIVSKNGVLLLNACPKADGTIPEDQQKILHKIGDFLKINGEAIYSTRPFWIHGEGTNLYDTGRGLHNPKEATVFTSDDIRYTKSKDGKNIYVFALGFPKHDIVLKSFSDLIKSKSIKNIKLLGSKSKIKWNTDNGLLKINTGGCSFPKDQSAYVWKVALK